jgi:hypothetical protein
MSLWLMQIESIKSCINQSSKKVNSTISGLQANTIFLSLGLFSTEKGIL